MSNPWAVQKLNPNQQLDFSFSESILVGNRATLFFITSFFFTQGKQTLGRQRNMLNQEFCEFWGDGQGGAILKVGSTQKLIYCAKFSLGQFYVAIQMVKLFPGKFWEIIINVSLNEDNPNKQVFQLGPLLMQRGHPQKVVHLGC